eukprot:gene1796-33216_t
MSSGPPELPAGLNPPLTGALASGTHADSQGDLDPDPRASQEASQGAKPIIDEHENVPSAPHVDPVADANAASVALAVAADVDPMHTLLEYERQIVDELIDEDALCIMAAGLGWQKIVAVFVRLHHYQQPGAVLLLGAQPWQRSLICEEIARHDPNVVLPKEINSEVPSTERAELYKLRTCCFVTTRILVVDFLSMRVKPSQIAESNSNGFIRAFSDQPSQFFSGFNKVEKVMRALHVRHVHLWPRFHQYVTEQMDKHPPEVWEYEQDLTEAMLCIQFPLEDGNSLFLPANRCLTHMLHSLALHACYSLLSVYSSDLKMENALFRSFDDIVRRQLDPDLRVLREIAQHLYHYDADTFLSYTDLRVLREIAQHLHHYDADTFLSYTDLRVLREIAQHLHHYDAVTFLSYLESLRQSEGKSSVWLMHDATHTMYQQARRRVYIYRQVNKKSSQKQGASDPARKKQKLTGSNAKDRSASDSQGTSQQERGSDIPATMNESLRSRPADSVIDLSLEAEEHEAGSSGGGGEAPSVGLRTRRSLGGQQSSQEDLHRGGPEGPGSQGQEEGTQGEEGADEEGVRRLREAARSPVLVVVKELHMCRQLEQVVRLGGAAVMQAMYEAFVMAALHKPDASNLASTAAGGGALGGRGRGAGGRGGGRSGRGDFGVRGAMSDMNELLARGPTLHPGERQALLDEVGERVQAEAVKRAEGPEQGCARQMILLPLHYPLLRAMGVPRRVEVYKAERPGRPMAVYHLSYSDSLEQQRYLAAVERELSVMSNLIEFKGHIMIPQDAPAQDPPEAASTTIVVPPVLHQRSDPQRGRDPPGEEGRQRGSDRGPNSEEATPSEEGPAAEQRGTTPPARRDRGRKARKRPQGRKAGRGRNSEDRTPRGSDRRQNRMKDRQRGSDRGSTARKRPREEATPSEEATAAEQRGSDHQARKRPQRGSDPSRKRPSSEEATPRAEPTPRRGRDPKREADRGRTARKRGPKRGSPPGQNARKATPQRGATHQRVKRSQQNQRRSDAQAEKRPRAEKARASDPTARRTPSEQGPRGQKQEECTPARIATPRRGSDIGRTEMEATTS